MVKYDISESEDNIDVTMSLPVGMLNDLVRRSKENGRYINIEIMLRLARSLEKDNEKDLAFAKAILQQDSE